MFQKTFSPLVPKIGQNKCTKGISSAFPDRGYLVTCMKDLAIQCVSGRHPDNTEELTQMLGGEIVDL